jgi:4-alpha-glucanotransferase
MLRIDHFRGFDRYYAIPAENTNARQGEWLDVPKSDLFKDNLDLNIVAEDLGVIDDGVRKLMADTQYPGMKILEFAFDGSKENDHLPSNYKKNLLCYTGTHENMPLYQYILDLNEKEYENFKEGVKREAKMLGVTVKGEDPKSIEKTVVELAFASIANISIVPLQDLLCQDGSTRMKLPSTVSTDNWSYRCKKSYFYDELAEELKGYITKYIR